MEVGMSRFNFFGNNFGQDNCGREFPDPIGIGLEAIGQPRIVGGDLLKVQDPESAGAWIVSDTTVEATQ